VGASRAVGAVASRNRRPRLPSQRHRPRQPPIAAVCAEHRNAHRLQRAATTWDAARSAFVLLPCRRTLQPLHRANRQRVWQTKILDKMKGRKGRGSSRSTRCGSRCSSPTTAMRSPGAATYPFAIRSRQALLGSEARSERRLLLDCPSSSMCKVRMCTTPSCCTTAGGNGDAGGLALPLGPESGMHEFDGAHPAPPGNAAQFNTMVGKAVSGETGSTTPHPDCLEAAFWRGSCGLSRTGMRASPCASPGIPTQCRVFSQSGLGLAGNARRAPGNSCRYAWAPGDASRKMAASMTSREGSISQASVPEPSGSVCAALTPSLR
jgi:hypothetical protein